MFYTEADKKILRSFSTSRWLKNAIETATDRDIVDALRDAETLVEVLREHARIAGLPA